MKKLYLYYIFTLVLFTSCSVKGTTKFINSNTIVNSKSSTTVNSPKVDNLNQICNTKKVQEKYTITLNGKKILLKNTNFSHVLTRKSSVYMSEKLIEKVLKLSITHNKKMSNLKLTGNTCFFDSTGLLCVNINIAFSDDKNSYTVTKQYYLKNKSLYSESKTIKMKNSYIVQNENIYIPFQVIEDNFGYQIDWKESSMNLSIKGNGITDKKNSNTAYEPIAISTTPGYYWSSNGILTKVTSGLSSEYSNKFSCTTRNNYISVKTGEKYRFNFYASWFGNIGSIVFLDKDEKLVKAYTYNRSTKLVDQMIIVPEKATRMHLTLYTNQTYKIDRETTVTGEDLSLIKEEEFESKLISALDKNQKKNIKQETSDPFYDKAYITFVLDDCRPDMDKITDIFAKQSAPLCIAAIPSLMTNVVLDGEETVKQVCDRVVSNGGEILAHHSIVLSQQSLNDFDVMFEHFFISKQQLSEYGYDVNGIILAGGTGMVTGSPISDKWARQYYLYSDLYGMSEYKEPYYHQRYWLANSINDYEQMIDKAIKNKQWISFYFHDTSEVSIEEIEAILSYINSKSDDKIEIKTYKELYDQFSVMD